MELNGIEPDFLAEAQRGYRRFRERPGGRVGCLPSGKADVLLIAPAAGVANVETFTRRFFGTVSHALLFEDEVVVDRLETGLALPVA